MIRKIICFLSDRFQLKITTIEKSKDVDKLKFNELLRDLQTYEVNN